MDENTSRPQFPLLQQLLRERNVEPKGVYGNRDLAALFNISVRTAQDWERAGRIHSRQLPGRGKYLSADIEEFLQNSHKRGRGGDDE